MRCLVAATGPMGATGYRPGMQGSSRSREIAVHRQYYASAPQYVRVVPEGFISPLFSP